MKRSPALFLARAAAIIAYAAIILTPTVVSYILSPFALQRTLILQAGLVVSLLAYPMFALQPLLSARMKWLDVLFGLDRIYRFHKAMAITSGVLILVHPLLLAVDYMDISLLTSFTWPWYVLLGKLVLFAVLVLVLAALLHRVIHRTYERWRWLHNLLAILLLAAGTIHAFLSGRDLASRPMQIIFALLLAASALSYIVHKLIGPAHRKNHSHEVLSVQAENPRVWTLKFAPGSTAKPLRHLPGQFQFITLRRGRDLPVEEHPFTISSAGTGDTHASTIKESGDYTAGIGKIRPGDRAAVQGPFGRFSYLLFPDEKDLVFIAGGIGITPFVSMLRHMQSSGSELSVLLLYANRTVDDITFREELETMSGEKNPRLKVIHVLESPPPDWRQERGRIDREMIARYLEGPASGKAFYFCGPPAMMRQMIVAARSLGARRRHLHWERFAL